MEISSKIHVEQPAPHRVHHQHSAKRDGQTKKTKRFSPPRWRVKSKPHQTWHGDKDLKHVLAPRKTVGIRRIVSPLRGAENLAETRHHQLKTSITP